MRSSNLMSRWKLLTKQCVAISNYHPPSTSVVKVTTTTSRHYIFYFIPAKVMITLYLRLESNYAKPVCLGVDTMLDTTDILVVQH